GQVIHFDGSASDAEDPSIPASHFTWQVDFQHDAHVHPFIAPFSGVSSGDFTIPTTGETSANVWYRIILKVTDSSGLSQTTFRDILPETSQITLTSNVPGLQVTLDGQPVSTPFTVTGVVGITRTLGVISPQLFSGDYYAFTSWSDAGAATHDISTLASDTTYTANFQAVRTWADTMGQNGSSPNDEGRAVAIDDDGNLYVTGAFKAAGNFGIRPPVGEILLAKYSPAGAMLWQHQ